MKASVYKKAGVLMILFGMIVWPFADALAFAPILLGTGLLASSFIIEFSAGFVRHAHKTALDEWTGDYYRWNNRHIRIIEKDGCAWVMDEDLISAAGMKLDSDLRRKLEISYVGYCVIPGTKLRGFNENAVLKFLSGKQEGNSEIVKLKLWFERDVFFPLRKKREIEAVSRS